MQTYNIKNRLIQADTHVLQHRGTTWTGTRYCVVLFNKDLNYKGESVCKRSERIKAKPRQPIQYIPTIETAQVSASRSLLLEQLEKTRFIPDRCSTQNEPRPHTKYGMNPAHILSFGITATRKKRENRKTRETENMNNKKYPLLYQLFTQYINAQCPGIFGKNGTYHACIISKNSQCEPHVDKHNIGPAVLQTLGNNFEGGHFEIQSPNPYNIYIPTVNRPNLLFKKTYTRIIKKYNLESQVCLLIQTDKDEREYGQLLPDLPFIRTPPGLLNTTNHLSEYLPREAQYVIMHDDISRICRVDTKGTRHTLENLDSFIGSMFDKMRESECSLGGVYPALMPLSMMKAKSTFKVGLSFIHDPFHFIINTHQLKIEAPGILEDKQDFVRSFAFFEKDNKVLRHNTVSIVTSHNKNSTYGYRSPERERESALKVNEKYPQYVQSIRTHKSGNTSLILKRQICV